MNPTIFGLTGGIASGKSTVARVFEAEGVPIIDADALARQLVVPGSPALQEISAALGSDVLLPDGNMDRKLVGARIFSDASLRAQLDEIMEWRILLAVNKESNRLTDTGASLICLDAPLLIEKRWHSAFRPVVVVWCPIEVQVERLMARNKLTEAEARARVSAQLGPDERVKSADITVDTTGTLEDTKARALEALRTVRDTHLAYPR